MSVKKRVIVCGQGFAGSTLLFNIIKFIYYFHGFEVDKFLGGFSSKSGHIGLLKCHLPKKKDIERSDFIFTCKRDIRDSVVTGIRRKHGLDGKHNPTQAEIIDRVVNDSLSDYYKTKKHSNYEFIYEVYKADPNMIIAEIAIVLGFNFSDKLFKETHHYVEDILPNGKLSDKQSGPEWSETFLTTKHMGNRTVGDYKKLDKNIIRLIEQRVGKWILENRYGKKYQ